MRQISRANRENLQTLQTFGEAIMRGEGTLTRRFVAGELKHAGYAEELERLAKAGLVEIRTVGQSTFANITHAGRIYLAELDRAV